MAAILDYNAVNRAYARLILIKGEVVLNRTDVYLSPLIERWPSQAMMRLWSPDRKFATWRHFWTELARALMQLGLPISQDQVAELERNIHTPIDYARVAELEKQKRHDVLAHIAHYGEVCPTAKPIIHLGATSCEPTDNTDLILIRDALDLIILGVARTLHRLASFARKYKDLATLAFTHIQPAQPTTVGKRATLWMFDLLLDLEALQSFRNNLMFRGVKGTTGTQASFLALFDGDHTKVWELEKKMAAVFGFSCPYPITGQTYTRKTDHQLLSVLSGLGASAHKMGLDIRLLQFLKEVEEPREKDQKGSSAMPYKRNPMRSERACALGRFLIGQPAMAADTHATQIFERTLDDSAIRRLYLPEAFLAADAVTILLQNIAEGLIVYPRMIERHLREELPFMASEEIIAEMVKRGGDRQECHTRLAQHSLAAGAVVKEEGRENDLFKRLQVDSYFAPVHKALSDFLCPERFFGRAGLQVEEFLELEVQPALRPFAGKLEGAADLHV
ncbi:MAG: adenylosuccinate lyase [Patescibacteria group bacterium]|nr:adenylosuccinate lyase [Patescibacteria group bacterium]